MQQKTAVNARESILQQRIDANVAENSCPSKRGQLSVKDRAAVNAAEDSCLCKKVQLPGFQGTAAL